ncbi:MAG TPA: hypothetical protein VLJ42_06500 [Solirubrobacteraceae bacterium]|nr:hypothetical protein [Solirubrobacteraceae bacterium]
MSILRKTPREVYRVYAQHEFLAAQDQPLQRLDADDNPHAGAASATATTTITHATTTTAPGGAAPGGTAPGGTARGMRRLAGFAALGGTTVAVAALVFADYVRLGSRRSGEPENSALVAASQQGPEQGSAPGAAHRKAQGIALRRAAAALGRGVRVAAAHAAQYPAYEQVRADADERAARDRAGRSSSSEEAQLPSPNAASSTTAEQPESAPARTGGAPSAVVAYSAAAPAAQSVRQTEFGFER